jgi:hypothetical protein
MRSGRRNNAAASDAKAHEAFASEAVASCGDLIVDNMGILVVLLNSPMDIGSR